MSTPLTEHIIVGSATAVRLSVPEHPVNQTIVFQFDQPVWFGNDTVSNSTGVLLTTLNQLHEFALAGEHDSLWIIADNIAANVQVARFGVSG